MKEQLDLLIQYLNGIWLNRRWIWMTAWVICPLGWIAVTLMPNQYTSEARVYADTQTILKPLMQGLAINADPSQELRLMVKTLLSRRNLETIARYTDADVKTRTTEEYEDLLDTLKSDISIQSAGKENLFTISFTGKDAQYAQDVVQASLDVFVENAVGQKKMDTRRANEFISTQLAEYEARLLDSEAKLADFKRKNAGYLPGSERGFVAKSEQMKSELEETRLQLREAQSSLISARRQLDQETNLASKQSSGFKTEYDLRLEALQTRLDSLLFRFTERHPDVRETRRQIEELKTQQSSSGSNAAQLALNPVLQEMKLTVGQMENQVASLKAREESLIEKIRINDEKLEYLPKIEAELTSMMRNYEVTKGQYDELLSRRESALLSQSLDAKSDQISFRIIDPPLLPREPSGPMRPLFLTVVLILAVGVGFALAFIASQIWSVAFSPTQIYKQLQLPVFGVVSATELSGLKKIERWRMLRFSFVSVLLLVFFVCFVVINSMPSVHQLIMQGKEML
ncbi:MULTISPECIES: XrtA system polysaccharide chain length determinant [Photobacterium]|uniref:Chain-length determining protein n=1 Tax=Photobacterium ganghwense TaxID=320778 RepID=A0A0J1HGZ4_9GAMM|nr:MULTISPECIES: XrtA system polysaccharide chain length determinant [Photobacterium]KLV10880.1 hypothetical protein ABT57_05445 [Photobacterium ganghwense]PSU10937.1 chain length determinant family protein [Photobacterium ganghwense]QSV13042.1 hypothetical protein FH974_09775 [Photobacterium ganghwense]